MIKGEWLLRIGTALSQLARACHEQERTRQLPMGSLGERFGKDGLVPPFHVLGLGGGGEPAWGHGTGLSQHAALGQPDRKSVV